MQDVDVLGSPSKTRLSLGGLRYALPVTTAIVAADQISKQWALSRLTQGPCSIDGACVELFGGARFHLTFNTGASFQTGEGLGPIIGLLAIVMSVVLLVMAWRRIDRLGAILLGGVAGGAIGNLIDRLFRADDGILSGAVVDFIEVFDWYPIFNIADMAIVSFVLALIAYSLLVPEGGAVGITQAESDDRSRLGQQSANDGEARDVRDRDNIVDDEVHCGDVVDGEVDDDAIDDNEVGHNETDSSSGLSAKTDQAEPEQTTEDRIIGSTADSTDD